MVTKRRNQDAPMDYSIIPVPLVRSPRTELTDQGDDAV